MKKLFAIIIIVGLALPVVAQISPYLEKGKSGFGLNVGYEQSHSFKGALANVGYSYKGIIDIEANFYSEGYDKIAEGLIRDDASALGFMGCINWWMIRKQPTPMIDVLFGLTAGVEHFAYSKYSYLSSGYGEPTDYNGDFDGMFGFDSRVKFRLDNGCSLMPAFALVYDVGAEQLTNASGNYSENYDGFMSRIGVSLSKSLKNGSSVYMEANNYISTFDA